MDLKQELGKFYYSAALCDLRLMNKKFLDQNITYNSLLYLELIYTMEGRCTASKIAELLNISKPAVTLKVNELIKLGLVTKTPDPLDHRQNLLSVNMDAIPKYHYHSQQDAKAVREVQERFSPGEIEKFCEMLRILSNVSFQEIESME